MAIRFKSKWAIHEHKRFYESLTTLDTNLELEEIRTEFKKMRPPNIPENIQAVLEKRKSEHGEATHNRLIEI